MVISLLPSISLKVYSKDGTLGQDEKGYYLIEDYKDLVAFATKVNGGETKISAKLMNDIDLAESTTPSNWTPIGNDLNKYSGTFDGDGYTISNLKIKRDDKIERDDKYQGFFGVVENGIIKNLTINGSITAGSYSGGICGLMQGGTTIEGCTNKATIKGTGVTYGGICGYADATTTVDDEKKGAIKDCKNEGKIEGEGNCIGGIIGNACCTVEKCQNSATITGRGSVGGICGAMRNNFTKCVNTGDITGTGTGTGVGGICGGIGTQDELKGNLSLSYNTGNITGGDQVGGVCGFNNSTVETCYNIGAVSGTTFVGGVCGYNSKGGTITYCYYNTEICQVEKAVGDGSTGICTNVIGRTTIQMTGIENSSAKTDDNKRARQMMTELNESNWNFKEDEADGSIKYYPHLSDFSSIEPPIANGMYIYTKADLKSFSERVKGGKTDLCAKVMKNIVWNEGTFDDDGKFTKKDDLASNLEEWTPIGNDSNKYTGTFVGNDHTIKGLYINSESDNVGLFGYVGPGGKVQNVGVIDGYIKGNNYVGGVCGRSGGTIEKSYNTGTVSGRDNYVGGVCGLNNGGTIENCYNTSTVSGSSEVGGVCGCNSGSVGIIQTSHNTGPISGNSNVGGVCGQNNETIKSCYNTGTVSGSSDRVGGVCGCNSGSVGIIQTSHNTGPISGNSDVGGVCGYNEKTIEKCYNIGTVSRSSDRVGGVCGCNGGSVGIIQTSYNTGTVSGDNDVGGVCGLNSSVKGIQTSYNTGTVSGRSDRVGGVCVDKIMKQSEPAITQALFLGVMMLEECVEVM